MTYTGRLAILIAALGLSLAAYDRFNIEAVSDISHITPVTELPIPVMEAEQVLVELDPKEFACMQTNIYYEARNEKTDTEFAAVGFSVVNRMDSKHYPSTACAVVQQKQFNKRKGRWVCMYSWFCDGKSDTPNLTNPIERRAWERSGEIAAQIMRKEIDNPIPGATMYHASYINPPWDYKKLIRVGTIGTHIYYIEKARV